ncbi:MAG: FHA domain-containing protein [Kiritimatiellaeota bacterium]|nr:FHA domain-containing protein [Kiritimatiellota bacterium]
MSQPIILKIHKSGLPDEKFIFEENGAYIIGRAPSCALSLSNELDGKISRRHLLLNLEDSGVRIRDIGSRNGTEVNGETLPKGGIGKIPEALTPEDRKLKPGDIVAMGDTTWTFDFFSQTEVSTNSNQDAPTSVSPSSAEDMSDSKQDAIGMPTLTGMPALPVAKLADEPEKRPESIQLNAPASPSTSKTALENSALEEAPTRKLKVPGIKPAPPLHSLETKAPVAAPPKEPEPAGIAPSPSQPPSAKPEEEKPLRKKSPTTPIVLSKKTKHSKPPVAGDNAAAPKPPLDGKLKLKNEDLQQEAPNAKDLESIAKKDVLEKLGTFDDTVEMEPEEFDNLDDLVFGVSREKPDKRTTKFKIKSPNPPKP